MTRLSINVNKIATLRNSRGGDIPNLLQLTRDIINFGADGITVHPRPDERHITYQDTLDLSKMIKEEFPSIEFNVEGRPSKKFLSLIEEVNPNQITLVPDSPGVLTSNQGWDIPKKTSYLKKIIKVIKTNNNRICLFVEPDSNIIKYVLDTGADSIELFTGEYANKFSINKHGIIKKYIETANNAYQSNIGVNAGHDLNLDNLKFFNQSITFLDEVSIGHALICDSLYYGLENTIQLYKRNLL
tara:strand:- start:691 stop:1419 length:729 start_codon:yes stop_codon:yes gene_type:complete